MKCALRIQQKLIPLFLTKKVTGSRLSPGWVLLFVCLISFSAHAQSDYPPYNTRQYNFSSAQTDPFHTFLQSVEEEAIAAGVSPAVAHNALMQVQPDGRVIERDQNQPEQTQTFATYKQRIVSATKVADGRMMMRKYAVPLKTIYQRYGVPPDVVVALWGMESGFGRNIGDYSIVGSLATLAYEGRRAAFFRSELINALKILDQERMQASELRGSWAGALGQCQFMPSTYLRYAVDADGDGRRDIWRNQADVFASIANYLAAEGWKRELTWGRAVSLHKPLPESQTGLGVKHSLAEWQKLGVRLPGGKPLPQKPLQASLVQPDGADGRSFLVYDNFRALMRWNRSTYFATSVGLLADQIRLQKTGIR